MVLVTNKLLLATGGYNVGGSIQYSQSESYDGTGWATSASLATGRGNLAGAGVGSPTNSGMVFNGAPGYSLLQKNLQVKQAL
jgi:hypothetical protein